MWPLDAAKPHFRADSKCILTLVYNYYINKWKLINCKECDHEVTVKDKFSDHIDSNHDASYQAIVHTSLHGGFLHSLPLFLEVEEPQAPEVEEEIEQSVEDPEETVEHDPCTTTISADVEVDVMATAGPAVEDSSTSDVEEVSTSLDTCQHIR